MGGGDLNTKKSWHPNTMKNQEKVWKAEQAAAEEKKRILELQRERGEERDREELNNMAKHSAGVAASDDRLHWMYNKPDKKVQEEDYLLGKSIDNNYDKPEKTDQDIIPAVARRVVGSSMITAAGDTQVDLARKMREDPLLLVKERERAARASLLNNPLHRRRLTELLKKDQEKRNEIKEKKKSKKKGKELDNLLAAKLSALGGEKKIDIATLLDSNDSSPDSSSDSVASDTRVQKKKKKQKKKSKKHKKNKRDNEYSNEDTEKKLRPKTKFGTSKDGKSRNRTEEERTTNKKHKKSRKDDSSEDETEHTLKRITEERSSKERSRRKERKRSISGDFRDDSLKFRSETKSRKLTEAENRNKNHVREKSGLGIGKSRRDRSESEERYKRPKRARSSSKETNKHQTTNYEKNRRNSLEEEVRSTENNMHNFTDLKARSRRRSKSEDRTKRKKVGMSEEEKAARLAEMAAAGAEHERERGRRVAQQRAEPEVTSIHRRSNNEARALPDSLQSRIHSNRHYIQRNERHMNEHFARR